MALLVVQPDPSPDECARRAWALAVQVDQSIETARIAINSIPSLKVNEHALLRHLSNALDDAVHSRDSLSSLSAVLESDSHIGRRLERVSRCLNTLAALLSLIGTAIGDPRCTIPGGAAQWSVSTVGAN